MFLLVTLWFQLSVNFTGRFKTLINHIPCPPSTLLLTILVNICLLMKTTHIESWFVTTLLGCSGKQLFCTDRKLHACANSCFQHKHVLDMTSLGLPREEQGYQGARTQTCLPIFMMGEIQEGSFIYKQFLILFH